MEFMGDRRKRGSGKGELRREEIAAGARFLQAVGDAVKAKTAKAGFWEMINIIYLWSAEQEHMERECLEGNHHLQPEIPSRGVYVRHFPQQEWARQGAGVILEAHKI